MNIVTMVKRINWLYVLFVFSFTSIMIIIAETVNDNATDAMGLEIDKNTKFVIFDTDMGADDA